jgi:F-box protein 21
MSNLEFPWLPEEILPLILHQFPPSRESDESVIALFTCAASSRVLRAAATSQALWQPHYRIRYTHESSSVKPYRQQHYNGDYYQMYSLRRGFDKAAIRKLDDMEHFEGKADRRHEHAQEIIKLYS